jgi:hypothetical protein
MARSVGDGASAPTLMDDWGHPIRPADLAQRWTFRGGSSREDIFRTMTTGLNGTPMPGFVDALKDEQRWAITDFIDSLSAGSGPGYANLVVARHVDDPIDLAKGTANFESARVARFPIIGQITEPTRDFHPPTTSVTVQAIYDAESIALLVRWHDMSAEKTGKNGLLLPVPREEEEEAPARDAGGSGGAGAGDAKNPFGDQEVTPAPAGQAKTPGAAQPPADPLPSQRRRPPGIRVSDAVSVRFRHRCRRAPASRTSSSAIRRTRWISVLRSGARGSPSVHRKRKCRHRAERHGGCHRCRELRPGRMVGHFQAAASRRLGRPVHARRVYADRFLGLGRVLA